MQQYFLLAELITLYIFALFKISLNNNDEIFYFSYNGVLRCKFPYSFAHLIKPITNTPKKYFAGFAVKLTANILTSYFISTIISASTAIFCGRVNTPTEVRACRPCSPNTSINKSEKPFITFDCSVKESAVFT